MKKIILGTFLFWAGAIRTGLAVPLEKAAIDVANLMLQPVVRIHSLPVMGLFSVGKTPSIAAILDSSFDSPSDSFLVRQVCLTRTWNHS